MHNYSNCILQINILLFSRGTLCPSGWYYYNNNCYYPSTSSEKETQANSRASCQAMGADLVSISDQDEMDFVLLISYVRTHISYCYRAFLMKKTSFLFSMTQYTMFSSTVGLAVCYKIYFRPSYRKVCPSICLNIRLTHE